MIEDGLGFMGFWSDIESDYLLSYQEWHNCEHMPERVSIPGFIEGRRYRGTDTPTGASFFMCYVTHTPDALGSAAYLAALNSPTPWTKEALTRFRNPVRTLYRRVASAGSAPAHRPYLALLRFDIDREACALAPVLDSALAGAAGVARSLFEVNAAASSIMTAERKIYSGGPTSQQFLAAFESHDKAAAADALAAFEAAMEAPVRNAVQNTYWQEARIRAVDVCKSASKDEEKAA
ncbi:MAG: hypothetical protein M9944_13525 [Rhizobiaceae bacterium]|nr:hypothetical protein [Rhizobiaceae bacterium]